MSRLFGVAVFLSAALLFLVQPMAAQLLLPVVGGSPQVWTTCMLFFQAVLLLGYLYAHVSTTRLTPRVQAAVHLVVMALAGLSLPIALPRVLELPATTSPVFWLLGVLGVMVGPAFFAVSTLGPVLQRWYSRTGQADSHDPYFLYAASNAGSAVGLLAYPLVLQRTATLGEQGFAWTVLYAGLVAVVLVCGALMVRRAGTRVEPAAAAADPEPEAAPEAGITPGRRVRWVLLAFIPSSLMLGVTQHVSTDVAAVPLLWVVPLLLYLVTMSMAFSRRLRVSAAVCGRVLPWLGLAVAGLMMARSGSLPAPVVVGAHVAFFVSAALMCHQMLADDRPRASRLTEFYLLISVGGVLGGVFNGLVAPLLFDRLVEYPLLIWLALLVRPQAWPGRPSAWGLAVGAAAVMALVVYAGDWYLREHPRIDTGSLQLVRTIGPLVLGLVLWARGGALRLASAVGVLVLGSLYVSRVGVVLTTERTFFGVHQVVVVPGGRWHGLMHGTTLHGLQARFDLDPSPRTEKQQRYVEYLRQRPASYYHPTGAVGDFFGVVGVRQGVVTGVIGLGAGSAAAYARAGDTMLFFEIDPAVIRLANDRRYFSFLADAAGRGARVGTVPGDGRLTLGSGAGGIEAFDLIVLDAFTSDAIPVHVITRDAFEDVYLPRLRPGGLIAVNTSNRHLNLQPVIAATARDLGLEGWYRYDRVENSEQKGEAKTASSWVVLARTRDDLGAIATSGRWRPLQDDGRRAWTDDYSDILSVFEWNPGADEAGATP